MIRTLPLMMAGLLALAATGCGTSGVPVSGSVKYGENPMALGLITIEPQAGSGTTGAGTTVAVRDGQFTIESDKNLSPGKYTVRISPPEIGSGADLRNVPPQFPLWETQVEIKSGMAPLDFQVPEMKKKVN